jgi:hypothetical protein
MDRGVAVDRAQAIVETIETELMPVPIREVWVYGDIALGLDPIDRLNVYLTKDILLRDEDVPDHPADVKGIGTTVRRVWAQQHPEFIRTNANGYAAPEKCLAAHLLGPNEPVHLEVCNTGFENNVTQRLEGARARGAYEEMLDPRGVCLWSEGQRSGTAFEKLRDGSLVFPTLSEAFVMLGLDEPTATEAAEAVKRYRSTQDGPSVRGDVV